MLSASGFVRFLHKPYKKTFFVVDRYNIIRFVIKNSFTITIVSDYSSLIPSWSNSVNAIDIGLFIIHLFIYCSFELVHKLTLAESK